MLSEKWDIRFLKLAREISIWSKDPSTQVGAVLVRPDKTIISTGFNGLPKNVIDTDALLNNRDLKMKHIIHAEENALIFARQSLENAILYTYPMFSCLSCANRLFQAGVKDFVSVALEEGTDRFERWNDSLQESISYVKKNGGRVRIYNFPLDNYIQSC